MLYLDSLSARIGTQRRATVSEAARIVTKDAADVGLKFLKNQIHRSKKVIADNLKKSFAYSTAKLLA